MSDLADSTTDAEDVAEPTSGGAPASADVPVADVPVADDSVADDSAADDAVVQDDDAAAQSDDAVAPPDDAAAPADVAEAQADEQQADDAAAQPDDADAQGPEVVKEDDALAESASPEEESPFDRPGKWYVVHTQSGYEKKVKQNLEARISSMDMASTIHEVVIPEEDVVELRGGKRVTVKKKMFPGYLLVRCRLNDDSWSVIRNTPGVTGFVGAGNKPSALPRRDVETFLAPKLEGEDAPKRTKPRFEYEHNETVRVREGPFADFSGEIIEINEEQLKVKVLVNIFGRETPVELEFSQIAKL